MYLKMMKPVIRIESCCDGRWINQTFAFNRDKSVSPLTKIKETNHGNASPLEKYMRLLPTTGMTAKGWHHRQSVSANRSFALGKIRTNPQIQIQNYPTPPCSNGTEIMLRIDQLSNDKLMFLLNSLMIQSRWIFFVSPAEDEHFRTSNPKNLVDPLNASSHWMFLASSTMKGLGTYSDSAPRFPPIKWSIGSDYVLNENSSKSELIFHLEIESSNSH